MSSYALALLAQFACAGTLVVGTFACGSDPDSGAQDASTADATPSADGGAPVAEVCQSVAGTRLTREYIEPAPGVRQEFGIFDSDLGGECVFRLLEDGSYQCHPADVETQVFFQDAACTSAIVAVPVGATPREFARARRTVPAGCFTADYYRRVGMPSAVSSGQSIFRQEIGGTCTPQTAPVRDYYLAGAELPPTSFVTATRRASQEDQRLSLVVYEGQDGSLICDPNGRIADTSLQLECSAKSNLESELFCMPDGLIPTDVFTNAGCSDETGAVVTDSCVEEAPRFASSSSPIECSQQGFVISEVGEEPIIAYDNGSGACLADDSDSRFYAVEAEVPDNSFASLATRVDDTGERLSPVVTVDSETFLGFSGVWYDENLDARCVFGEATDGSFRCLPEGVSLSLLYRDEKCSDSVVLAHIDSCQTGRKHVREGTLNGTRVRSMEPFDAPVYRRNGDLGCDLVSGTFLEPAFELSPSSFVLGEIERL